MAPVPVRLLEADLARVCANAFSDEIVRPMAAMRVADIAAYSGVEVVILVLLHSRGTPGARRWRRLVPTVRVRALGLSTIPTAGRRILVIVVVIVVAINDVAVTVGGLPGYPMVELLRARNGAFIADPPNVEFGSSNSTFLSPNVCSSS